MNVPLRYPDVAVYCEHAHTVEWRLEPKPWTTRGIMIHDMGGQVGRVASDHYLVRS